MSVPSKVDLQFPQYMLDIKISVYANNVPTTALRTLLYSPLTIHVLKFSYQYIFVSVGSLCKKKLVIFYACQEHEFFSERSGHYVSPKSWYLPTSLHGVITHKKKTSSPHRRMSLKSHRDNVSRRGPIG
jgi:hypothetical protein